MNGRLLRRPRHVRQHLFERRLVGSHKGPGVGPDLEWGAGRFTPLFPKLMRLLAAVCPPPT